jgi:glycine betaine/proline transport system ATP-binding protein
MQDVGATANSTTTRQPGTDGADPGRAAALSCRKLWKLFGHGAEEFLQAHPQPEPEQLAAAGLIGAVRDVAIEVRAGEAFVIMGLSGSGKSTLVRCLSRLIEATAGEVIFEGRDLLRTGERELIEIRRHKMGMVFQHFALLPHLNVLDNVAFPLSVQGVSRARREKRAREVIDLVGLSGREGHFPRQLSGGQQQRVGIARSLAVQPQIWFLDEPFSALDPLIRREMQDELLRLQGVLHKTIVFITHDFHEAIRLADRIAIMKDGAVVQIGTPEELVLHPATGYVAEFTRDVERARAISAGSIMRPLAAAGPDSPAVPAKAKLSSFAAEIVGAARPFAVVEEDGRILGEIWSEQVIDILAGRERKA